MTERYFQDDNGRVILSYEAPTWGKWKAITAKAGKAAMAAKALDSLAALLPVGATVYTLLRHKSASGELRAVSVFIAQGGKVVCLDPVVARALDYKQHSGGGLVVRGSGFSAGFEIVYNLGESIWPNGTPEPHAVRDGEPDSAGGYALRWESL
jgi:hypothetical protein